MKRRAKPHSSRRNCACVNCKNARAAARLRADPEQLRAESAAPIGIIDYAGSLDYVTFFKLANRLTRIAVPPQSEFAPLSTHEEIERRCALHAEFEAILNELRTTERTPLSQTLTASARRRRAIEAAGNVLDFRRKG